MNKLKMTLSTLATLTIVVLASTASFGQHKGNSTNKTNEDRISNTDLIKLATKAPNRSNFSSEEAYSAAKQRWVEEYPDANARINGRKSTQGAGSQSGGNPISTEEQAKIDAKQAWIEANPDEYARMLEGNSVGTTNAESD